jgi:hypothetical protein
MDEKILYFPNKLYVTNASKKSKIFDCSDNSNSVFFFTPL